jgi:CRP/FNR family cyclic AMP-dependent transcriptional regulator
MDLEKLIQERSAVLTYPAKKVFLEPGMILDGVYYVVSGRTCHYMMSLDGTEKILYTLAAGWFYGETPCSLSEPTGLYSKTEVKTTLYKLPIQEYEYLMDTNKLFRETILYSYSRKMLILRHEIENLTFNSCKDRLKRLFCSVADTSRLIEGAWYGMNVSYTQYELSTIVGGARVTVSKLISELCAEGFIRMLNHKLQINAGKYRKYVERMEAARL